MFNTFNACEKVSMLNLVYLGSLNECVGAGPNKTDFESARRLYKINAINI